MCISLLFASVAFYSCFANHYVPHMPCTEFCTSELILVVLSFVTATQSMGTVLHQGQTDDTINARYWSHAVQPCSISFITETLSHLCKEIPTNNIQPYEINTSVLLL